MQRDQKAYLWDILNSVDLIRQFMESRKLGRLLARSYVAMPP